MEKPKDVQEKDFKNTIEIHRYKAYLADIYVPILRSNFQIKPFVDKNTKTNHSLVFSMIPNHSEEKYLCEVSGRISEVNNIYYKYSLDRCQSNTTKYIEQKTDDLKIFLNQKCKTNLVSINIDLFNKIVGSIQSNINFKDKSINIPNLSGIEILVNVEESREMGRRSDQIYATSQNVRNHIIGPLHSTLSYGQRYITFLLDEPTSSNVFSYNENYNTIFTFQFGRITDAVLQWVGNISRVNDNNEFNTLNDYVKAVKSHFLDSIKMSNFTEMSFVKFTIFLLNLLYKNNVISFNYIISSEAEVSKTKVEEIDSVNKIIKFISENIVETTFKEDETKYTETLKIYDIPGEIYSIHPAHGTGSLNNSCMRPNSGSSCRHGKHVYDHISKVIAIINEEEISENKYSLLSKLKLNTSNNDESYGNLIARAVFWENIYLYKINTDNIKTVSLVDRIYGNEKKIKEIIDFAKNNNFAYKQSQSAGEGTIIYEGETYTNIFKVLSIKEIDDISSEMQKSKYLPYLDTLIVLCAFKIKIKHKETGERKTKFIVGIRGNNSSNILIEKVARKLQIVTEEWDITSTETEINYGIQSTNESNYEKFTSLKQYLQYNNE